MIINYIIILRYFYKYLLFFSDICYLYNIEYRRGGILEKAIEFILSSKVIGSLLVVIISIILFFIIKECVLKYIEDRRSVSDHYKKKRLTILYMCVSTLKYIIFLADIIIILGIFHVDVSAFLAGLGIFGIVIGLALQDLLKDFIAGIMIILDSQYSVGDYVNIEDYDGEVIGVGLKSTKVRDYGGDIRIFSNREISKVINYSRDHSKAIIHFTFSSDENLLKLEKAMEELIKRCDKKLIDATNKLQYKGVEKFSDSELTLRLTVNVKPTKQYSTTNTILREAKILFDELDIKIK